MKPYCRFLAINLEIPVSELALYDQAMKHVVEPGEFELQIGNSSDNIEMTKHIYVTNKANTRSAQIENKTSIAVEKSPATPQRIIIINGTITDVQSTPVSNVLVRSVNLKKTTFSAVNDTYHIQAYTGDTPIFSGQGVRGYNCKS